MDLTISARPRQSGFRSATVSWRRQAPRSGPGLGAGRHPGWADSAGPMGTGRWGLADGAGPSEAGPMGT